MRKCRACFLFVLILVIGLFNGCTKAEPVDEVAKEQEKVTIDGDDSQKLVVSDDDSDDDDESDDDDNDSDDDDDSDDDNDDLDDDNEPNVEIKERSDVSYEEMLAATMIIAISMEYPDMEVGKIYLASESDYDDGDDSEGVYVFFTANGEEKVLYSNYLEDDRDNKKDLHSHNLGYSSYELLTPADVDADDDDMKVVTIDDLSELLKEAVLVSIVE